VSAAIIARWCYTARVKTNAARILESLGIAYELRDYDVDEEDLSAESVARKVGLPPEQVFKTLVARGDRNGVCFARCSRRPRHANSCSPPPTTCARRRHASARSRGRADAVAGRRGMD
jgi:hypothetical protein